MHHELVSICALRRQMAQVWAWGIGPGHFSTAPERLLDHALGYSWGREKRRERSVRPISPMLRGSRAWEFGTLRGNANETMQPVLVGQDDCRPAGACAPSCEALVALGSTASRCAQSASGCGSGFVGFFL